MKKSAMSVVLMVLAACVTLEAATPLNQQRARKSPEWLTEGVMYQMYLRAFTPEGTLKVAQERLPRLAELGVTAWRLCSSRSSRSTHMGAGSGSVKENSAKQGRG